MHNEADSRALRPQPLVSSHHEPMRVRLNALSAIRVTMGYDMEAGSSRIQAGCGAAVEGLAKVEQQQKGRKAPTLGACQAGDRASQAKWRVLGVGE